MKALRPWKTQRGCANDAIGKEATISAFCHECGEALDLAQGFCRECGSPVKQGGQSRPAQVFCRECGEAVDASLQTCPECGTEVRKPDTVAGEALENEEDATDTSSRTALAIGGVAVVALIVIGVFAFTGGGDDPGPGSNTVTASHPSGVRIEANVSGGDSVEITEADTVDVGDVPEYTAEESAWRFSFDGEVVGETTIELPAPQAESFSVIAGVDGVWRPIAFNRLSSGNLEVIIPDAGDAASATAAPVTEGVFAAPSGGVAHQSWSELWLAIVEVYEDSWLDDLTDSADELFDDAYATYDSWANPRMCTQELSGVDIDDDANAKTLIQVCVEDRAAGPRIKIGNNTRFALEIDTIAGVDVEHRSGGVDLGWIGSTGIIATGGETTEWTAADGSTLTVAAEFTEYAFLRQVVTWVLDLIPGGTEYFDYAEKLGEAISIFKDAWGTAGGLTDAIEHLLQGEYRAAFSDVVSALGNEGMIDVLIREGFFAKLGYELSEDAVKELFSALQIAGHLADLGDLLYTAWATDGYVHGEVIIRLPAAEEPTTSSVSPDTTGVPADGGGAIGYGESVIGTLGADAQHGWTFDGSAGDEVVITLIGLEGLDPVLDLIGPDGDMLDTNDDFDGTDSRIERTLPGSGTYTIIARGYDGADGDYELALFRAGDEPVTTTVVSSGGTIEYDEMVTGALGADETHIWQFDASEGDVITLVLVGPDIDPVILLNDPAGNQVAYEDNYGHGGDEVVANLRLADTGTHTVEVYDYGGGSGDYRLELWLVSGSTETTTSTTDAGSSTTLTVPTDVGTGDVQITLLWSSIADLDLYVLDPDGNLIYYERKHALNGNGGELDEDANAGCTESDTSPVENVFWPAGAAPRGDYEVRVHAWGACEAAEPVSFDLVVTLDGVEAHRFSDSVYAEDREIYTFTY